MTFVYYYIYTNIAATFLLWGSRTKKHLKIILGEHQLFVEHSVRKIQRFLKKIIQLKIFDIFGEAVLTSIHNLCFGAKLRKIGVLLQNLHFLYKSGVQGVHFSWTCLPDVPTDMFDKITCDLLHGLTRNTSEYIQALQLGFLMSDI